MANPDRGEIDVKINGEVQQIRYSMAAIKELEMHFKKKGISKIFEDAESWGADDLSKVFFVGLKRGSMPDVKIDFVMDALTMNQMRYYFAKLKEAMDSSTQDLDEASRPTVAAVQEDQQPDQMTLSTGAA